MKLGYDFNQGKGRNLLDVIEELDPEVRRTAARQVLARAADAAEAAVLLAMLGLSVEEAQ